MICCFMNFHENENAEDLIKHFDREIEHAIDWGCTVFVTGTQHSEDKIFAQRVTNMSKYYADGEIKLVQLEEKSEKILRSLFINIADWEIYSYERDCYPYPDRI